MLHAGSMIRSARVITDWGRGEGRGDYVAVVTRKRQIRWPRYAELASRIAGGSRGPEPSSICEVPSITLLDDGLLSISDDLV